MFQLMKGQTPENTYKYGEPVKGSITVRRDDPRFIKYIDTLMEKAEREMGSGEFDAALATLNEAGSLDNTNKTVQVALERAKEGARLSEELAALRTENASLRAELELSDH